MKCLLFIISITVTCFVSSQLNISFSAGSNGQTFSTCSGFIIDSGGQGGPGYSNNENTVITICSDTPGDYVSVTFNLFSLSTQDDNPSPTQTNVDYMTVYDGTSTAANTLGTYSGNDLQGVVIMATNLNPSGCLTFEFTSNTIGTGMFTASASCNTPCADPVAQGGIVGGITNDSIRVCVGELVNFVDQGSFAQTGFNIVGYEWDFMDNTTANTANAAHSFSIPGLYHVNLFVTDDNPDNTCDNNNLIDLKVVVATLPDFTGFPGDTTLCIGESVTFTTDPNSYEVLWDGFPNSAEIDDGCLTDNQLGVAQEIDLVQTGFISGSIINSISDIESICFELEHTFMGDLVIQIFCPNGQSMILHQQGGGGTQLGEPNQMDGIDCNDPTTIGTPYNYCFTPSSTDTWVEWVAAQTGWSLTLPAGDYEPIDPFSNLIGCPANGVWTFSVTDNWAADDGAVFSFTLDLDASFDPVIETFTPQIGLGADSSYWSNTGNFITNISSNGDNITITPTAAGTFTYTYTVIDDFGCTHDTTVNVTVNPLQVVDAGNDTTVCDGAQLQLNGQVTGVSGSCDYSLNMNDTFGDSWNGNNVTVTVNGTATNYTLAMGSTSTELVNIPDGATVTVTFNANGAFVSECSFNMVDPNGTVVLTQGPNLAGPTTNTFTAACPPNFVYNWTPPAEVSDATILDPIVLSATPQTFVLSVYPIGHPACVVTDDIVVGISVSPNAGNDNVLSICSSAPAEDLFPLLGAAAASGGIWLNPALQITAMPYDPATMNPGDYIYVVENNGCFDTATVVVTEINTDITSALFTDVDCYGSNNGSITIIGTNITSYKLNNGALIAATSPVLINPLAPGTYTVDVFGGAGCSDNATLTITEPLPLQITSLTSDMVICPNETVPLTATATGGNGVYIYSWLENGTFIGQGNPFNVTPLTSSTDYCVVLSEACGSLPDTQCMHIDYATPIAPSVVPDIIGGCYPFTVNFTNTTASTDIQTVTVNFGDGTIQMFNGNQAFSHEYVQAGLFTVQVTIESTFGCTYVTTYTNLIEGYNYPQASFTMTPYEASMFSPHFNLINQSSPDVVSYLWDIPFGDPSSSVLENLQVDFPIDTAAIYPITLYVTNDHGCIDSITHNATVYEEVILFAPNTFTPDGDEFNQTWRVFTVGIDVTEFNLKIFNRWGQIVWESNDVEKGWDGIYKGQEVQDGTYTWVVSAGINFNDKRYSFEGSVNVLR